MTMLRWSSARDCPRKAALEAGPPDREWTDYESRIMYRGRSLGRDTADWYEHAEGGSGIVRELKIEWPLGTGHADFYIERTRTLVEVLSSAHATPAMIESKLVQLVGYLEHFPEAEHGRLTVVSPSDFQMENYEVVKGTERYEQLVEEVILRIEALERWRDEGILPDRVCAKPDEARSHFCRFADTCFQGWEPPPLPEVDRPEVVNAAADVLGAKIAEWDLRRLLADAETERKLKEQVLAAELEGQPMAVLAGPYRVRRTDVQRKPTLDLAKAELAGALSPSELAPYMRPGAAYTIWNVDRTEAAGDVDYGEVPF